MKKTLLILAALLGFAVAASAQSRALGVRIGPNTELSYQHTMPKTSSKLILGGTSCMVISTPLPHMIS